MTSDILIIGGGVIGLATAIELKLRGAKVTAISRHRKAAAATAAATPDPEPEPVPLKKMPESYEELGKLTKILRILV